MYKPSITPREFAEKEETKQVRKLLYSASFNASTGSTEIVPDTCKACLQKVIRMHVKLETVIHSDGWKEYQRLADMGYSRNFIVHH
jgi:hypothetical protein